VQRDLVEAARHGDHEAFEVLATNALDRLYSIARLILHDTYLAEDAVQEALVKAWRSLPTLREPERFDAWLHRLLVNACADAGRRQRRWQADVHLIRAEPAESDSSSALVDRDRLERGFRRLKPEQRTVVVLHFHLGLPAREIADIVGVPVGTVKSRIHYATELLRAALDADDRSPVIATNGRTA